MFIRRQSCETIEAVGPIHGILEFYIEPLRRKDFELSELLNGITKETSIVKLKRVRL
jgi:hypothetical protein